MRTRNGEPNTEEAYQVQQTLDKFESDLMSIFDCDPNWPLCLYNFTHKNKCPKYVAMKV